MNVESILKTYFQDYKEFHFWAIVITLLLTVIFQIFQAIYVSRKIENYKIALKKSEIKFSRFNELQIESLKSIYDKLVTFHYKNRELFYPSYYGHDSYKLKISNWINNYQNLMDSFHREKILLPNDLELKIIDFNNKFNVIQNRLNNELLDIDSLEDLHQSNDVQVIYINPDHEKELIENRTIKFHEVKEITESELIITDLRKCIEGYFKSLTN